MFRVFEFWRALAVVYYFELTTGLTGFEATGWLRHCFDKLQSVPERARVQVVQAWDELLPELQAACGQFYKTANYMSADEETHQGKTRF